MARKTTSKSSRPPPPQPRPSTKQREQAPSSSPPPVQPARDKETPASDPPAVLPTASPTNPHPGPPSWPPSLPYLTRPLYSPHLTQAHLTALRTRPPPSESDPSTQRKLIALLRATAAADPEHNKWGYGPTPFAEIKEIKDERHPACGERGLFATGDLRPGQAVVVYWGEVHPGGGGEEKEERKEGLDQREEKEAVEPAGDDDKRAAEDEEKDAPAASPHSTSNYDLWLSHPSDLAIDAHSAGNEARFINDYRRVPLSFLSSSTSSTSTLSSSSQKQTTYPRPNAEFRTAWDPRLNELVMVVFVCAAGKRATGRARTVGIRKGEEVLVSYGKGFWRERMKDEEEG